ncbi:MAG: septal ring lytic transglycosylase RlpA family protein [Hyphomicrobiaceae bacterium]|nr:septal ring lytic transglycosylase RlpA family protein [Hyphomicrobiaceae bacterium]
MAPPSVICVTSSDIVRPSPLLKRRALAAPLILTVGLTSACSSSGSAPPRPTTGLALDRPSRLSPPPQPSSGAGTYKIGTPYKIGTKWYVPREQPGYDAVGIASWYGLDFHGRSTANGEIYDMHALTAAHPTLPLPSHVRVENVSTGRSIIVRVNDRGPFVSGRIIDLSHAAASALGFTNRGLAHVRVTYVGRAPISQNPS